VGGLGPGPPGPSPKSCTDFMILIFNIFTDIYIVYSAWGFLGFDPQG